MGIGEQAPPSGAVATSKARELFDLAGQALERKALEDARRLLAEACDSLASESALDEDALDLLDKIGRTAAEAGALGVALQAFQHSLDQRANAEPVDQVALSGARLSLANVQYMLGAFAEARQLLEPALALSERELPPDSLELQKVRGALALTLKALGETKRARELQEIVVTTLERTLEPWDDELTKARGNLALTRRSLGDAQGALSTFETMLEVFEARRPEYDRDVLVTRLNLASTLLELGQLQAASDQEKLGLAACAQHYPPDHPLFRAFRGNHAVTLKLLGLLAEACELQQEELDSMEGRLPEDHSQLNRARKNLSISLRQLGDLDRARVLQERVLSALSGSLPPAHPELLGARMDLAITKRQQGWVEEARVELEEILVEQLGIHPPGHPDLIATQGNLAICLMQLGDLDRSRRILEEQLDVAVRNRADLGPEIQASRNNLGIVLSLVGDLRGARALQERLLSQLEQSLPAAHPSVVDARVNLANTLRELGEPENARALLEQVVSSLAEKLAPDHPRLLAFRANLAIILSDLGQTRLAIEQLEGVLELTAKRVAEWHPDALASRTNLASNLLAVGEFARARELLEQNLRIEDERLAVDHPKRMIDLRNLAWVFSEAEDSVRLESTLGRLGQALRADLDGLAGVSVREASERLLARFDERACLLALGASFPSLRATAFEIVERSRHWSGASGKGRTLSPELRAAMTDAGRRRRELQERLLAVESGFEGDPRGASLEELVLDLDRLESELLRKAREEAPQLPEVTAPALAAALPEGALAIGFVAYSRGLLDSADGGPPRTDAAMGAFVLASDGELDWIELGDLAPIADAAEAWRTALGANSLGLDRGVGVHATAPSEAEQVAAARIAALVLHPLLPALAGATEAFICFDGPLHAIPWDALPAGDALIGDRLRVHVESSFGRLVASAAGEATASGLLLVGGLDYGVSPDPEERDTAGVAEEPALDAQFRAPSGVGPPTAWSALPGTRVEVEAIASLAQRLPDATITVLDGARATKSALASLVPEARWLHLATHGWFAREENGSSESSRSSPRRWNPMGTRYAAEAFLPMSLCGLALSGANSGADSLGYQHGVLTAEELAAFDLGGCDLAVLSACETNVGVVRAGQGIRSLQAALHAAGARSSITSLWRVGDDETRAFFEDFYRRLWVEGKPKWRALRETKAMLRESKDARGRPVYRTRDWAAWVLAGEPD